MEQTDSQDLGVFEFPGEPLSCGDDAEMDDEIEAFERSLNADWEVSGAPRSFQTKTQILLILQGMWSVTK